MDFGLVHFALTNLGLFIVGAEAEALLGTVPFLCVYGLSASAGGIASMASDASKDAAKKAKLTNASDAVSYTHLTLPTIYSV